MMIRLSTWIATYAAICIGVSVPTLAMGAQQGEPLRESRKSTKSIVLGGCGLNAGIGGSAGLPTHIWSGSGQNVRSWLHGPVTLQIRNEVSNATAMARIDGLTAVPSGASGHSNADALGLVIDQQLTGTRSGLSWDFAFNGRFKRVGHEVVLDWPVLDPNLRIFTPTEYGVMDVARYPTFRPVAYAAMGWDTGQSYVLPLVSVLDPRSDKALTIALPPDRNIPHLQVEWMNGKILRLTLGHRAMGRDVTPGASESKIENQESKTDEIGTSPLRILLYAHPADYRSVLKAYSDDFHRYFRPVQPLGKYDGAFWYHHIQDHPAFDEMARQNVRYIWSSFWFTHLGEYLPDEKEWHPYTYAKWWKLGQTMSDEVINAFVRKMHGHGIATFAYFNVTEYGGAGGKGGDTATAQRILKEKFANALMKNAQGKDIPTWEGAMAMNAGTRHALWPFLEEQVRRHLQRLPEIDGFAIDRLDWASLYDYGHHDGLTMIGDRPVENMAVPVGEAVRRICEMTHAVGKHVLVNQFYRVEVLRNVDGYCHENDYLRALGYLSPYRHAAAWHMRKAYQGDLLQFEAQLKRRLQWALLPQMIAHEFPISQQAPNARTADLLEIYAPLFATLAGKVQILLPHCVGVTGANDVNLFRNGAGHYVVPVTSKTRFLSRPGRGTCDAVTVSLRMPDAGDLAWAHVWSAEGPPYRATIFRREDGLAVTAERHGTSSMIVIGSELEPALTDNKAAEFARVRERLFPRSASAAKENISGPVLPIDARASLVIRGAQVGVAGPVAVFVNGGEAGQIAGGADKCRIPLASFNLSDRPPAVGLVTGDEGTWFVPERIDLWVGLANDKWNRVAEWTPDDLTAADPSGNQVRLQLAWCTPTEVVPGTVRFESKDTKTGGQWIGRLGTRAAWIPNVTDLGRKQNGYQLEVQNAQAFTWADGVTNDNRVPQMPNAANAPRKATCWFSDREFSIRIVPPDAKVYRLTLYLLDYDRNGRSMDVAISNEIGCLDTQRVSAQEAEKGVYVSWVATGEVSAEVRKVTGHNAVISGVFVDVVR